MGKRIHVITISRQYGAGGAQLGSLLSERLGIPLYNHQILSEMSRGTGIRENILRAADERMDNFQSNRLMEFLPREERGALEAVMGHGLLAIPYARCHPLAVRRIPSYRKVDHPLLLLQRAVYHSPVPAYDAVLLQLGGDGHMRGIVLADKKASGGIPVDPVNDTGPHHAVDAGKAVPAMIHERIDQRMAVMAGCRMHYHPLRLVHHKHIVILIQNVERDILRQNIRLHSLPVASPYLTNSLILF